VGERRPGKQTDHCGRKDRVPFPIAVESLGCPRLESEMTVDTITSAKQEAREILAVGVQHYNGGNYAEAENCFNEAALLGAYLATIYIGNLLAISLFPVAESGRMSS
jgi:hypothetical protein